MKRNTRRAGMSRLADLPSAAGPLFPCSAEKQSGVRAARWIACGGGAAWRAYCLPQAAGELLPGLVDEREGSAVAVGGVAYQDRAVTAGALYTVSPVRRTVRGLTPLAHVLPSLSVIAADSDARWLSARRLSNILVRVER
jgi:hypothetical protein